MADIKNNSIKLIEVKPCDMYVKSQKKRTQKVRTNPTKNIQPNLLKQKLLEKLRSHKIKSNPLQTPLSMPASSTTSTTTAPIPISTPNYNHSTLKSALKKSSYDKNNSNNPNNLNNPNNPNNPNKQNKLDKFNKLDNVDSAFNDSLLFLKQLENKRKAKNKNVDTNKDNVDTNKDNVDTNKDNVDTNKVAGINKVVAGINKDKNLEIHTNILDENSLLNKTESSNEPKYGCLKNGTKPTYRQWKRGTQKYNNDSSTSFIVGKVGKVVGVFIPNDKTRKKRTKEIQSLHNKKLSEMRSYLKKNCLLKSGSHAPSDVIRKIYEQATLTGDVNNTNSENLVHNYMAD